MEPFDWGTEPWHFIVLDGSVDSAVAALGSVLQKRKYLPADATTVGVKQITVFRATLGSTVIWLGDQWQEDADTELAQGVSRECRTDAAVQFSTSKGDYLRFETFTAGAPRASFVEAHCSGDYSVTQRGLVVFRQEVVGEEELRGAAFESAKAEAFQGDPFAKIAFAKGEAVELIEPDAGTPVHLWFLEDKHDPNLAAFEDAVAAHVVPLLSNLPARRSKASTPGNIAFETPTSHPDLKLRFEFAPNESLSIVSMLWRNGKYGWHDNGPTKMPVTAVEGRLPTHPKSPDEAMVFAAAHLVRNCRAIAAAAPVLADLLERIDSGEAANAAVAAAAAKATGEERNGWQHARVVFRGNALMIVETDAPERFTFRFDTSLAPPGGADVAVNRIIKSELLGLRALQLRIGSRVFNFDEFGKCSGVEGEDVSVA